MSWGGGRRPRKWVRLLAAINEQQEHCAKGCYPARRAGTALPPLPLPAAELAGRRLPQGEYLLPTAHCDAHAAEIVALADAMKARCSSEWDFAEQAYDFVRNEILYAPAAPTPDSVVELLERGHGICIDKSHLLVALLRAGGVAARYAVVAGGEASTDQPQSEALRSAAIEHLGVSATRRRNRQRRLDRPDDEAFMRQRHHPLVEMRINGLWFACDPFLGDDDAAGANLPLPRLGYDPLILAGAGGSIVERLESFPETKRQARARRLYCKVMCGEEQCANRQLAELRQAGRQRLEKTGIQPYLAQFRRFYIPLPGAPLAPLFD